MAARTVAVLALVLLAAGCGGHERRPPPSKAVFAREADAICATSTTRSGRVARLRALRAPAGKDDLYAHWLKAERDALALAKPPKEPRRPDDPDPAVLQAIVQGKIAGYARRLGAEGCAKGATGTLPP